MWDESTTILNAESQNQLNKQHDDLHRESLKLLLLKKVLLEAKQLRNKDDSFEKALKIFRAREFLHLEKDNLLNLNEHCANFNLSYMAQKEVQKMLWQMMQTRFHSIGPLIKKLHMDFPHLFDKKQRLNSSMPLISTDCDELLGLDLQRRDCLQKLAATHNRKLRLLKAAAEIKLASGITEKIEVMHLDLCINQVKANLFRDYMINEFVNNSEHTAKAIKFIEKHIDEEINKHD